MRDFQQTITSLDLLHTSLYRMELFMNAQAVKNAKTDVISLISRLEKAEREHDELRERLSLVREQRDAELNKNTQLEAELERRDAAAGEPVAVVDIQRGRGYGKKYALCYTSAGHSLPNDIYNLYTTPPAPSVPDGWKLMPLKASPEILQAGIKAHYERQKHQQPEDVEFKGPMECAYDDMLSAAPAPGGDGG